MQPETNGVKAWSYSAYALYSECPARFKYAKIDKLPDPPGPALVRGDKIHRAADAYLSGKIEEPTDVLRSAKAFDAFEGQFEELRALSPIVEQKWGFTDKWRPTRWVGPDTWFRAIADAVVLYDDNTADVIDHKTGKMYATNDEQMELFGFAIMCRFPDVRHVTTRLWYLDSGDEVIREHDAADKGRLRKKWEEKVRPLFTDQRFPARPNEKCRWCPFSRAVGGPCKM